ncbi:TPA: hypothetical protein PTV74_003188 [Clostridium botulinum]|nr:hypothetical protein [Clostridium botulinum]HDK7206343.1 hypothetical protein [Clostridium botulinum]HDK7210079.1 hypothetical protein [Clostridium botulinum]HDK7265528.1 hypothetical protein [Clostridium botulinum]HDK7269376.1 hypothetical protein [Clostridium botulinum]
MDCTNKFQARKAIVIENDKENLILIEKETKVRLITDETDFKKEFHGIISFVDCDTIEIENTLINWNYVKEIEII